MEPLQTTQATWQNSGGGGSSTGSGGGADDDSDDDSCHNDDSQGYRGRGQLVEINVDAFVSCDYVRNYHKFELSSYQSKRK